MTKQARPVRTTYVLLYPARRAWGNHYRTCYGNRRRSPRGALYFLVLRHNEKLLSVRLRNTTTIGSFFETIPVEKLRRYAHGRTTRDCCDFRYCKAPFEDIQSTAKELAGNSKLKAFADRIVVFDFN